MTDIRQTIIDACLSMARAGLSPGKSGNASVRTQEGLLITPTGVAYDCLGPDDIVLMSLDGDVQGGSLAPSSEWRFHAAIYRARPEAGAVVHCHSRFATAVACTRQDIPAFHYMVAGAGGDSIRCADYATFGSEELARNAVAALKGGRRACLLANHGQIAVGATIAEALALAFEVETLAMQYVTAIAAGGPKLLDPAEMTINIEKFKTYGPPAKR
jgi:L-fuculose-phosphate aldolase